MTDEKETYESATKKRFNELVIDEYADFTKEQFELLVKQREKAVERLELDISDRKSTAQGE